MTQSASARTASQTLEDGTGADTRALVRRLVREQIRPQAGRVAAAFACMIVVAAATAGMVLLIGPVIDDVLIERDREMLYLIPGAIVALALVTGTAGYAEAVLMDVIGHRLVANLQRSMYGRIICADLRFFHDNAVGQLISRFVNDAALLRSSIARALTGLVKDSLTVVFLVAVMFVDSWQLALVTVVTFPLALYPIRAIGRRMRKFSRRTQVETGDLTTMLDETFRGIRHVKAYTMEGRETERAGMILEKIYRIWRRSSRVQALSRPLMETLGGIALALAAFFGGILVIQETLTAGALASFMAAVLAAYKPMKSIATLHASLQQGLAAAQRIFQLEDLRPSIADRPGARAVSRVAGNIRFDGVRFGYGDGARFISFGAHSTHYQASREGRIVDGRFTPLKDLYPEFKREEVDRAIRIPLEGPVGPELDEILRVIQANPHVFLNTGHVSPEEAIRLVDLAGDYGIEKVLVATAVTQAASTDQLRYMAGKGAFIEYTLGSYTHTTSIPKTHYYVEREYAADEEMTGEASGGIRKAAEQMREVGTHRCILATDFGGYTLPTPVEGMREFIACLLDLGIPADDIRRMVKTNPEKLLGLDP